MGQSTNAVLFYGYCWDEETSEPWNIGKDDEEEKDSTDDDEDWETRYANLKGLKEPAEAYPERHATPFFSTPRNWTPEEQVIVDKYSAYWDAKTDLAESSGCEVDLHCHGDAPMPYVCIKKSQITTYRGDMTVITQDTLKVEHDWDQQLVAFCDLMGIDVKDKKPAWYMVSYWG